LIPRSVPKGLTLIEITLAITLGALFIAGGMVIYNQAMDSSASSRMKSRVMSTASLVEEHFARSSRYPTAPQLRSMYTRRMPGDYLINPWRGPVGEDATRADALGDNRQGIHFVSQAAGSTLGGPDSLVADGALDLSGSLIYCAISGSSTASYYDKTRAVPVEYRGFSISGVSSRNEDGWHVTGPRLHE